MPFVEAEISNDLYAQPVTHCSSQSYGAVRTGEQLSYELVYNWGIIWATAGRVQFSVRDTMIKGQKKWLFKGQGESLKSWDWFYKVRSNYESMTGVDLRPEWFRRHGKEGTHLYNHFCTFRPGHADILDIGEDGSLTGKTIALTPCAFDVISAIYYCRTLEFLDMKPGETVPLDLVLDGELHHSYVRFLGRETWKDKRDGKAYSCVKFRPLLMEGTVFSAGEKMTVWATDDERRIPVYIETDLAVGKAKVYLTAIR